MPMRGSRLAPCCGRRVPYGQNCPCELKRKAGNDQKRPSASARGYGGKWREAREGFLAAHPMCNWPGCVSPATHVDHIVPHKGDMKLFWKRSNWQGLCALHHNSHKQSMEKRGRS
jgi:5-methylcytosine-specific restriction enzyme A